MVIDEFKEACEKLKDGEMIKFMVGSDVVKLYQKQGDEMVEIDIELYNRWRRANGNSI